MTWRLALKNTLGKYVGNGRGYRMGRDSEGSTWIDRNRARCLAAMSWYKDSTAKVRDTLRYSLYILCVPERES